MFARASTFSTPADRAQEGIQMYEQALSQFRSIPGNKGAMLLVERGGGGMQAQAIGITLWETEDAMQQSRQRADEMRQQSASQAGSTIERVQEFEVAVWQVDA